MFNYFIPNTEPDKLVWDNLILKIHSSCYRVQDHLPSVWNPQTSLENCMEIAFRICEYSMQLVMHRKVLTLDKIWLRETFMGFLNATYAKKMKNTSPLLGNRPICWEIWQWETRTLRKPGSEQPVGGQSNVEQGLNLNPFKTFGKSLNASSVGLCCCIGTGEYSRPLLPSLWGWLDSSRGWQILEPFWKLPP